MSAMDILTDVIMCIKLIDTTNTVDSGVPLDKCSGIESTW